MLTPKAPFQAPLVSKCLIPKMNVQIKKNIYIYLVVQKGLDFEQYRQQSHQFYPTLDQSFPKEASGNHWHLISALNLTVVLLSPQVVGLLFSSQYGRSHQAPGSAHSGWHHGHQTLLLWPHHP